MARQRPAQDRARDRELVKGHRLGDSPEDATDPKAEQHVLRFSVSAETYATFREAVGQLQRESESRFEDDELLLLIARKLLAGPVDEGRSSYQIAITTCEQCQGTWQEAHGELVALDEVAREKAACDAQHIGCIGPSRSIDLRRSLDPSAANDPNQQHRATQSIPPGTRRSVMRRHHGCCVVPGCRHATFVDVHHVHLRSEGGDHDPEHLVVLCGAHHTAVHEGRLLIGGSASVGFRFRHADGSPYGSVAGPLAVDVHAKAFFALTNMGYKEGEARRALEAARQRPSHVGADGSDDVLEYVIRRALHQLLPKSMRAA